MDRSRVAIVIPALNEAATIAAVVERARPYGAVVVVDDGSTDDTAARAAGAGAAVVSHERRRGYDEALASGFRRADGMGCAYVVTLDADGQHDPATLDRFLRALDGGADVVLGVRDRRPRLAEHLFALVGRLRWGLRDPLCGMKGYRMDVYRELGHFDSYGSIGTELAVYAAAHGKVLADVSIITRDRADAPRFGRRLSANLRILRALWLALSGPGEGRRRPGGGAAR